MSSSLVSLWIGCLQGSSLCTHDIYRACKDVVTRLLDKHESSRLGSMTGASEVKAHKWFSKTNWGLLRNTQPPVSDVFLRPLRDVKRACPLGFAGDVTATTVLGGAMPFRDVGWKIALPIPLSVGLGRQARWPQSRPPSRVLYA